MKRVLIVLILAAAGYVVWNNVIAPRTAKAGESEIAELERQLDAARSEMVQAGRTAGMSGLDTTADAGAAAAEVERIEARLKEVSKTLKTPAAQERAERLQKKIDEFNRQLGN